MTEQSFNNLYTRSYSLADPYAGVFNKRYLHFIIVRVRMFDDENALFCLRENVWATEGKLEMIRCWESYEYRRELMQRLLDKGVVFSTNPKDYFERMHTPQLTRKFLNTIESKQLPTYPVFDLVMSFL